MASKIKAMKACLSEYSFECFKNLVKRGLSQKGTVCIKMWTEDWRHKTEEQREVYESQIRASVYIKRRREKRYVELIEY